VITERGAALNLLAGEIQECVRCPRLVQWREQVAREKRAAFSGQEYWGRPVPGFGDPDARLVLLGLAPAAHGANRTGRMFTGDRSGDFLYAALWRAGLADSPISRDRSDGLSLSGVWVTAAVRCAPPANRPAREELTNCMGWSERELTLLRDVRVILCLGGFAWNAALELRTVVYGESTLRPRPRFTHGCELPGERVWMLGCYHPSQQNTFTGRLTEPMIDSVVARARTLAGL
jgi:uracil-DNA glycosylase family 4